MVLDERGFKAYGVVVAGFLNFFARVLPIEEYLAQLKASRDALKLQLGDVNAQMSNFRAHYQQSRTNWLVGVDSTAKWRKNYYLKQHQPRKEKLQGEILAVKTEIARIQALKKQGVKTVKVK